MAASTSTPTAPRDHDRLAARPRPAHSNLAASASPRSPRTPQLGRSISSQYGSPSGFRGEQEDVLVYELTSRYLSAGYAGESRPRCILPFTPDAARRVGDYRQYDPSYASSARQYRLKEPWGSSHELFSNDLRGEDLGLVEDKLERILRTVHMDHLQLDNKPRKTVLVVPSLIPTPVLDVACKVLFGHFTQTPSISVLTHPTMCCVGAGVRNGIVVDIGWDETIVTAVGEYKEIAQRRSVRAGKFLTREMANTIKGSIPSEDEVRLTFAEADDLIKRIGWCQQRTPPASEEAGLVQIPVPGSDPPTNFSLLFDKLAEPAEKALFASSARFNEHDDHDLPLHLLIHKLLISIPTDFRALCISRVMVTGLYGTLPGLKRRILQEVSQSISSRGWDIVSNYGSAKHHTTPSLRERAASIVTPAGSPKVPLSPSKMPLQEAIPAKDRVHDDIKDSVTQKVEQSHGRGKVEPVKGIVGGVDTLGAWAGASLMTSLRIKGAHEVEREEYVKSGLREVGDAI